MEEDRQRTLQDLKKNENARVNLMKVFHLTYIASAQKRAGDLASAHDTLKMAVKRTWDTQDWGYLGSPAWVAECQAEAGDIVGARQTLFDALKAAKFNMRVSFLLREEPASSALAYVVQAKAKIGDIADALSLALRIPESRDYFLDEPRAAAIGAVAEAQARAEI